MYFVYCIHCIICYMFILLYILHTLYNILYAYTVFFSVETKLATILNDFKAVQQYLVTANLSTAPKIRQLADIFKAREFYQSCAKSLYWMLQNVCYKTSAPDDSKAAPVKC